MIEMNMLGADLVNIRIGLLPLVALGLLIAGCTSRSRLGSKQWSSVVLDGDWPQLSPWRC
jgi:hypothetical protein